MHKTWVERCHSENLSTISPINAKNCRTMKPICLRGARSDIDVSILGQQSCLATEKSAHNSKRRDSVCPCFPTALISSPLSGVTPSRAPQLTRAGSPSRTLEWVGRSSHLFLALTALLLQLLSVCCLFSPVVHYRLSKGTSLFIAAVKPVRLDFRQLAALLTCHVSDGSQTPPPPPVDGPITP